jgi:hypothetical protein
MSKLERLLWIATLAAVIGGQGGIGTATSVVCQFPLIAAQGDRATDGGPR